MSIIEEYAFIAKRQRQIGIEEGRFQCPTCQTTGYHQYYDEEGCLYYTVCDTCKNPLNHKPPNAYNG
jgi:hypothetical protein